MLGNATGTSRMVSDVVVARQKKRRLADTVEGPACESQFFRIGYAICRDVAQMDHLIDGLVCDPVLDHLPIAGKTLRAR